MGKTRTSPRFLPTNEVPSDIVTVQMTPSHENCNQGSAAAPIENSIENLIC